MDERAIVVQDRAELFRDEARVRLVVQREVELGGLTRGTRRSIRRRLNSTEAQTSGKESSKVELPLHMLYLSSSTCVPPADNDHFI